ncbi:hypothetical protein AMIS_67430 [Actinoplanes missouriensis 431]|uniref:Uncharacterized protein n=1 Tax=Actinoplanes missouriensis (strain ATCC 14538 / DSM 43046 / CBS 188.64 / JCM 3121 / NBRC 102363 / NCIMB 12654 / NRRL B-3342 / UNCC 431) TaxID=512565 RepID=I0HG26_ACTM4|nr:hypothetical protein [Actinoplanes missouriensis]BAL91963.1 hypothetical protein AMIS_67430 [Actinoplanes missouriensis 431]
MPGHALHAELAAIRALVSHGLAEVTSANEIGQFWVRSACARLAAIDTLLTEAAGAGAATGVRALSLGAASIGAVLLTASLARASVAGMVAAAALILVALAGVTPWAAHRARMVAGRRRLARLPAPAVPWHTPVRPGLISVPEELQQARVRLVSAVLRHVGADRWTAPELRLAARTDPVTRRLAGADLLLCQALDCLERYLFDISGKSDVSGKEEMSLSGDATPLAGPVAPELARIRRELSTVILDAQCRDWVADRPDRVGFARLGQAGEAVNRAAGRYRRTTRPAPLAALPGSGRLLRARRRADGPARIDDRQLYTSLGRRLEACAAAARSDRSHQRRAAATDLEYALDWLAAAERELPRGRR